MVLGPDPFGLQECHVKLIDMNAAHPCFFLVLFLHGSWRPILRAILKP